MSEREYQRKIAELEHGTLQERALCIALRYGQIDGAHHKTWVIDQMVRLLAGGAYPRLVELHEAGGEHEWDTGIAP